MSLRAFHLAFILMSVVLSVFVAAWATGQYRADEGVGYAITSAVAVVAAAGLGVYANAFRRKTRNL